MSSFSRPNRYRAPAFTRATQLGPPKSDLERDSGFSDASSEYLSALDLTDSEDVGRNGSIVSTVQDMTGPQVAVMGGSYGGLSPMIIMNNFVLKQPSLVAPAEKQMGFSSPLDMMPQSQVVFLQPMVSNSSTSPQTAPEPIRQSKGYMPILKSYPKIAPHPADLSPKTLGSSRRSSASVYNQRQRRHRRSHRLYSSPSPQPPPQTLAKPVSIFEAASDQSDTADSQDTSLLLLAGNDSLPFYIDELRTESDLDEMHDPSSSDCNRRQRFSNTYNILNKSGLLGITMRTKQLIKENKHTQGQLQQLQEQTGLLLEALSSGDPNLWSKLQLSLQRTDKERGGAAAPAVLG